MPHFFLGNLLFFGSRSQSSGDFTQDVSLCNLLDLGASWPISPRSFASLSLRLPLSASVCPPLGLNSVCLRCRHSASGGIDPWRPVSARTPSCASGPLSHPYPKTHVVSFGLRQAHPNSANLLLPTFSCQPSPANLPLPQTPSFTACARARTRRFSSSRGSAASARSSAIRE